MWAAYNGIANLAVAPAYTHFTVNHSVINFLNISLLVIKILFKSEFILAFQVEFVSAQGATTNHVECFWKNAKSKFKKMNGVDGDELTSYLKEFMWFKVRNSKSHKILFKSD